MIRQQPARKLKKKKLSGHIRHSATELKNQWAVLDSKWMT